jgi:microcystin-dependent protein
MSEPFIAEIRMVGFTFAPRGWAFCDGQLLPISQNTALFSLVGTTYGGDGRTTFGLPDLRGRVPVHQGTGPGLTNRRLGERGGTENETLLPGEIPSHTHAVSAANAVPDREDLQGAVWTSQSNNPYTNVAPTDTLRQDLVNTAGGGQAHNNMGPWIAIRFCIALQGLYPSRN